MTKEELIEEFKGLEMVKYYGLEEACAKIALRHTIEAVKRCGEATKDLNVIPIFREYESQLKELET